MCIRDRFKSDYLLQKAGGIAMAEGMKTKLEAAYVKAGIVSGKLSYTFSADFMEPVVQMV